MSIYSYFYAVLTALLYKVVNVTVMNAAQPHISFI